MKPIRLFGSGTKSRSENITAQTRTNMYFEMVDDKGPLAAYGTPGLTLFTDFGDTPVRGMYAIGTVLYVVHRATLYTVNNAGVATSRGLLTTSTGRVSIVDNGLQLFIADGTTKGYLYTIASTVFAAVTDGDAVNSETVTFNDSFFIVNKASSGEFHLSASYNGAAWAALDFATCEANPDNLIAVRESQGHLVLFGDLSIEHWSNTGALDFPYSRIGGATSEWGLAARWSIADFNNSLIFLAKSRQGEVQAVWLNGYTLERVSTFDIENIFNGYTGVADASAFGYLYNGHPFYQINFNSVGKSWLYDGASQLWSELKSGSGRHLSDIGVTFNNSIKTANYTNGKIYTVDKDNYTDDGTEIISELTAMHTFTGLDRVSISELQVDCETGNILTNYDPSMMLQVSKDGGHTWGNERLATLGKTGDYLARAKWNRLGQARDWVFKLKVSASLFRAILGIWVSGG